MLIGLTMLLSSVIVGCSLFGIGVEPSPTALTTEPPSAATVSVEPGSPTNPVETGSQSLVVTDLAAPEASSVVEQPASTPTRAEETPAAGETPVAEGETTIAGDPYAFDAINLFIHCNCPVPVTENQRLLFTYTWSAKTREQAEQFREVSNLIVKLNDREIPDSSQYWDPVVVEYPEHEYPFLATWKYSIPAWSLPTGYYRMAAVIQLNEPYSDGVTEFDPGEVASGFVDFQVTKAPVEKEPPDCVPFTSGGEPTVNLTTSGCVHKDEIWRETITLTGDVTLAEGVDLTIEPGTVVNIIPTNDDIGAGEWWKNNPVVIYDDPFGHRDWGRKAIKIDTRLGTLAAVGSAEQPIIFQTAGDVGLPGGWEGLEVGEAVLKYVRVFDTGRDAVRADRAGSAEIAFSEMHNCGWSCIRAGDGDWIHHNLLESGEHQALLLRDSALAEHNRIHKSNTGIVFEDAAGAVARNNIVTNSTAGIVLRSGKLATVANNTVVTVDSEDSGNLYPGSEVYPDGYAGEGGILVLGMDEFRVVNNIVSGVSGCGLVLEQPLSGASTFDYNLVWDVECTQGGSSMESIGDNTIISDPMFKDAAAFDFHVFTSSPVVDGGDPSILNPDGSPSHLGAYGGPEGAGWGEE